MNYTLKLSLHYPEGARNHEQAVRDALTPFAQHAVITNEGADNEERGFIDVEKCYHDEVPTKPCEKVARWEVGRGKVI
ncbi:hypothetical protein LCGC14_2490570 [marine sediment metagenome]|uniref:Uncharacterized protein n=1 Tax=marine sediment metagenome TaxID=412755 RepID=A0A0F9B5I4_9ZZZZ